MKTKKMVYVAGPYTGGDPEENTMEAMRAGAKLWKLGLVPFVPHLSHFWHKYFPLSYVQWLAYDIQILKRCDALLRLKGVSPGADQEIEFAKIFNIPVFHSIPELLTWSRSQKTG
jgi:hypothetical protein